MAQAVHFERGGSVAGRSQEAARIDTTPGDI